MPLPNFDEFKAFLAGSKRDDQSWGNLLRDISKETYQREDTDSTENNIATYKLSLIKVLGEWDFYSSQFLDQAASDYKVKSWQVTEYIEALRDALAIGESDLIIYEAKDSPATNQSASTSQNSNSESAQPEIRNAQDQSTDPPSDLGANTEEPKAPSNIVNTAGTSKTTLVLTGLVSALIVILIALIIGIANQRSSSLTSHSSDGQSSGDQSSSGDSQENSQGTPPKANNAEVYFTGINLPVTNSLCNKKRSFCIYNLATLVNNEAGEASYTFSDIANGEQVSINGKITISNIERNGDNRSFTFAFRDDQNNTTPGWAAAGFFNLDQDPNPSKPGILTRFKTTESFGPKTPIGLENTSYLFPN